MNRAEGIGRQGRRGVLLVGTWPPPPGGVETITRLIWDSPLRERHQMSLFVTRKSRGKEFSGRFDTRNAADAARQLGQCLWVLACRRPRHFHCPLSGRWTGFLRDIALLWLAKLCGCYTIAHSHGATMDRTYARAARWQKRLIRLLLLGVDHFLVLSPYWQRHFARLAPRTPITVLPNAVRPLFLVEAREGRAAQSRPFTVLFVGEIGRRKGVYDLVEAAAIARRSNPTIAVRLAGMAGEPAALDELRRRIEELDLRECVTVVGPRYDEDLLREYLEAEVFVLPTHAEGQPVALIEAMATGACVISTTIPPVASVVEDGVDGLLVPPGDVEALATAIVQVAGDPALRARLGRAAMRTVRRRFTPERFLADLDRFYQRLE